MADVGPNYGVEQQKLIVQISTLRANMERGKLDLMEIESRRASVLTNLKSSEAAIVEFSDKLESIRAEHGEPQDPTK